MALDRNSTYAEIEAQYVENIDYELTASTSSAKLFYVACELLIHLTPDVSSSEGATVQKQTARYVEQRDACITWLRWHGLTPTPSDAEPSVVEYALDEDYL